MSRALRVWPQTLVSRLLLILLLGLLLANGLTLGLLMTERTQSAKAMMLGNLEYDVATSVAILDHLPAAERPAWTTRLDRPNYHYLLNQGMTGGEPMDKHQQETARSLTAALGARYPLKINTLPDSEGHLQAHLQLSDGSPLTLDLTPRIMPFARWLPIVLAGQFILLLCCTWFAVRNAVRPLTALTRAAESLHPNTTSAVRMPEDGPLEVRNAARAFNAMQDRIAAYLKERMHILAAISHDLQTPITRIRLRSELMEENEIKTKLLQDLTEMTHLVREGVAYARTHESSSETPCRIQPHAFIDSLVCDYQDTGQAVTLSGQLSGSWFTKPHALRRTLSNLIDNALKFSGSAEVRMAQENDTLILEVLDRGPGIPPDELYAVMQPFYRVESSRNRQTGGTGLGLAIAWQLVASLNGSLTLANREGGGLAVTIILKESSV
ncbi:HAMP domain-containing protein [Paramixta manurensis]|uniref:Sensor histidine kinase EnvZ n=1 Tax=Paramixta manurensis TaxID=2740817 RepID=A0A6M8ULI3_9GAMM|nr:HAMP domain-containing protein [Erwiniaceae bacterium PD-1]